MPDPEFILTGARMRNISGQNGASPRGRALQSFQQLARRPDNSGGTLLDGRNLLFLFDSSNTSLKNSADPIPFLCTPIVSHEYRQPLNI